MRTLTLLSRLAFGLGAAQLVVGLGVAVVPNTEGWLGGLFYALMYALPLLLLGLALRSPRETWHGIAGWLGLLLGAFFALVMVGNWTGYSTSEAIFATSITVPTVALDLAIFWATVLRHPTRSATSAH